MQKNDYKSAVKRIKNKIEGGTASDTELMVYHLNCTILEWILLNNKNHETFINSHIHLTEAIKALGEIIQVHVGVSDDDTKE